jgi:muramoyltetrapeptide carboxypeptidase
MVLEHDHSDLISRRFAKLELEVTFGDHVDERDAFDSSSIASRVADLHDAFADPDVQGILTVIGGFNSNELLPYLDWDLIARNPKIFCGYSDITALQNAILARTGLVTYSGPHWSTFGMRDHLDQTLTWFQQAVLTDQPFEVHPASQWTDDLWFLNQDTRTVEPSSDWWALQPGVAAGHLVGGNAVPAFTGGGGPAGRGRPTNQPGRVRPQSHLSAAASRRRPADRPGHRSFPTCQQDRPPRP